jgi:hypothetical protein
MNDEMNKAAAVTESGKMPEVTAAEKGRINATQKGEVPYKVGPGHPPIEARFKPGWKGGPGCPPGTKHFTALIYKLASAEITSAEAIDGLQRKYGVKVATHFVQWFDELAKIAMDPAGDAATRRAALADLLKFFVKMPSQDVDLGGQKDNPLAIEAREKSIVLALLGSIPAPENGGTEAPEQHEK